MTPNIKLVSTLIKENWKFKDVCDEDSQYRYVAQFPTNIHLDLIHHGIIPDPYFAKNELDVQWVGEKDWVYKVSFKSGLLNKDAGEKAVLVFEGLDTHATVVLNGKEILKTENMFIPERVDVSDTLKEGADNELVITFESTFLVGKKIEEEHPDHHFGCWNGDKSRLAVRKAQYHYVSIPTSLGTS